MKAGNILVGLLLLCSSLFAQQKPVTISPAKPTAGDTITVSYHPKAPGAKISNPDTLILAFQKPTNFVFQPSRMGMTKDGNSWSVSWEVSRNANYGTFYFKSGDQTDRAYKNRNYEIVIYKNGHPTEQALEYKASTLNHRYNNQQAIDSLKVALLKRKHELYPDNLMTKVKLLDAQIEVTDSLKLTKKGHQILKNKLAQHPDSSALVEKVIRGYNILGAEQKGDSLKDLFINRHPHSPLAIKVLSQQVWNMEHSRKKLHKLKKVAWYTNSNMDRSAAYNRLFQFYRKEDNVAKMAEYAAKAESTPWPWKATQYNTFANGFAQQGDSLQLALLYAEKALQAVPQEIVGIVVLGSILEKGQGEFKAGYIADSTAKAERKKLKNDIYATFGAIQLKRQKYHLAEKYLKNAIQSSNSIAAQKHLADLYLQTDRPRQAYNTYWNILRQNPSQEDVKKKIKQAYIAFNSSPEEYDKQFKKLMEAWRKEMRMEFNDERINESAPSLTSVVNLQGKPINKKSLNNNVLVINFWATWCGPCINILPEIQKAYQAYKNNPEVKFIALGGGYSDSKEEIVKWVKQQDLNLPWYFDKGGTTTESFELIGIPTIIFVNKKGMIQFKTIVSNRKAIAEKIKLRVDMLLDKTGSKE